jgi:hypothetical protein
MQFESSLQNQQSIAHAFDNKAAENILYMGHGESVTLKITGPYGVREVQVSASGEIVMILDERTGDALFLKERNFAVIGDEMLKAKSS